MKRATNGNALRERIARAKLVEAFEAIAKTHHVSFSDIVGVRRTKMVVRARHAAMQALRARGFSYPEIGWFFDRDHTTVMAACRKEVL